MAALFSKLRKGPRPDRALLDDLKQYIDDNYAEDAAKRKSLRIKPSHAEDAERPAKHASIPNPKALEEGFPGVWYSVADPDPEPPYSRPSLDEVLRQTEATFSEHRASLLHARSGKDSEVYKRAEVSKQLFSKILSNKDYQPTKNTAIQLALGLQLNLPQTQELLE